MGRGGMGFEVAQGGQLDSGGFGGGLHVASKADRPADGRNDLLADCPRMNRSDSEFMGCRLALETPGQGSSVRSD
jgi:hypothetical protein